MSAGRPNKKGSRLSAGPLSNRYSAVIASGERVTTQPAAAVAVGVAVAVAIAVPVAIAIPGADHDHIKTPVLQIRRDCIIKLLRQQVSRPKL